MSRDRLPTFEQYIIHIASTSRCAEPRREALFWVRDRHLMGTLPRLREGTSLGVWTEFWSTSPAYHRSALGRLWKEWRGYRRRRMLRRR